MTKIFNQIKIVGLVTFIPLLLLAGPLTGYFAGDFLEKRYNLPAWVVLVSILSGFIASIVEIVRIVKLCLKIDKD